ncbi:fimbrial protein [Anopheles sinensis]|uniref:Fimbrial protein n=1 Tax=Anopheles sinensis TaxID=74873 RepID=A0A084W4J6_ANOSI|nr:fimbrial protein [Anopheles sinensis]
MQGNARRAGFKKREKGSNCTLVQDVYLHRQPLEARGTTGRLGADRAADNVDELLEKGNL